MIDDETVIGVLTRYYHVSHYDGIGILKFQRQMDGYLIIYQDSHWGRSYFVMSEEENSSSGGFSDLFKDFLKDDIYETV